MTNKEIQEAATRLIEGQTVIIDDMKFKAVEVTEHCIPCFLCKFFDSCSENMNVVCAELEMFNENFYKLEPVDEDNEEENRI